MMATLNEIFGDETIKVFLDLIRSKELKFIHPARARKDIAREVATSMLGKVNASKDFESSSKSDSTLGSEEE